MYSDSQFHDGEGPEYSLVGQVRSIGGGCFHHVEPGEDNKS